MHYQYKPKGICPNQISFDIDENKKVSNIQFVNGCDGNLKVLSKLLDGKDADEIVSYCSGNTCDLKKTSCADQLSIAIKEALDA